MKFDLPKTVKKTLDTILANGYKAYIVGGCVRDLLCGKVPHDYDIATDATPQEIKSLFSKTVDTGIKHGTVTVITDGEPIEVTTFIQRQPSPRKCKLCKRHNKGSCAA